MACGNGTRLTDDAAADKDDIVSDATVAAADGAGQSTICTLNVPIVLLVERHNHLVSWIACCHCTIYVITPL